MNHTINLENEISTRLNRYSEHFDTDNATCEFTNILPILDSLEQTFKLNEILLCYRKIKCICPVKQKKCLCDDDNYATITGFRLDLASNCRYIMDLTVDYNIKVPSKHLLRLFMIKDDDEVPLLDIEKDKISLFISDPTNPIIFDIEELKILNKTIICTINYMTFRSLFEKDIKNDFKEKIQKINL